MFTYTKPQLRALEWLPSDGAWKIGGREISAALNSLRLYHRGLIEREWRRFNGTVRYWRLTAAGIEAKMKLKEGKA